MSSEMVNALTLWYDAYCDRAPWLGGANNTKSMGLPALIASEIARQITIEMKWSITGKTDENGQVIESARAEYLSKQFEKIFTELRQKLEIGCAAGGMAIRPYPVDNDIYFAWTANWSLYPVAFTDGKRLSDVIFRDVYTEGRTVYTRLERHTLNGDDVIITQKAYKSTQKDSLGEEVALAAVPQWADLQPEIRIPNAGGPMFGWFSVAAANNVDIDSPLGVSVFHKALKNIREADEQWSRLMWEFEGSELAIDVDPVALRPAKGQKTGLGEQKYEMPGHADRLFRAVDLGDDHYNVFSPAIRDSALINGLNRILMVIEDLCGLSRGTLSDMQQVARTATELRILRQRTYTTIADNQAALERCLREVIHAMDVYADLYNLAPAGEYEVSFEWDDSILTDRTQEMAERMQLMSQGVISRTEMRQWYTGETEAQARQAIEQIQNEAMQQNMEAMAMQMGMQQDQMDLDGQATNPQGQEPEAEPEQQ